MGINAWRGRHLCWSARVLVDWCYIFFLNLYFVVCSFVYVQNALPKPMLLQILDYLHCGHFQDNSRLRLEVFAISSILSSLTSKCHGHHTDVSNSTQYFKIVCYNQSPLLVGSWFGTSMATEDLITPYTISQSYCVLSIPIVWNTIWWCPHALPHPCHTFSSTGRRVLFENRPSLYLCNYKENYKLIHVCWIPQNNDFMYIMEQYFH